MSNMDYLILENKLLNEDLINIQSKVRGGVPTAVFGVSTAEKIRAISSFDEPILMIVRDSQTASKIASEVCLITGEKSVFLPAKDDLLLYKSAFNKDSLHKRLTAIYEIQNGSRKLQCCRFK